MQIHPFQLNIMAVSHHLTVPAEERDMAWLKQTLQTAIELEHSTLPLYLAAMFSLEVQNYTTYNLIRSVAMEEMVHMAIACNTLAAIGGTPRIKDLSPAFPGHGLPGGAEPDLDAVLARLSPEQVKNFMRLELPAFLLPEAYKDETYPTIAKLYDAILAAAEVEPHLKAFDEKYTGIMNNLEAMWNGPADKSWPTFGQAVGAMTELRVLSCFYIMRYQVPSDAVAQLQQLYPDEYTYLSTYTDLSSPVFYGPRFFNLNVTS